MVISLGVISRKNDYTKELRFISRLPIICCRIPYSTPKCTLLHIPGLMGKSKGSKELWKTILILIESNWLFLFVSTYTGWLELVHFVRTSIENKHKKPWIGVYTHRDISSPCGELKNRFISKGGTSPELNCKVGEHWRGWIFTPRLSSPGPVIRGTTCQPYAAPSQWIDRHFVNSVQRNYSFTW